MTQADLLRCTDHDLERLRTCLRDCLACAALRSTAVDKVILTGGSTLLPAIRDSIVSLLPNASVFGEESFVLVGLGLTEEARRLFG